MYTPKIFFCKSFIHRLPAPPAPDLYAVFWFGSYSTSCFCRLSGSTDLSSCTADCTNDEEDAEGVIASELMITDPTIFLTITYGFWHNGALRRLHSVQAAASGFNLVVLFM